MNDFLKKLKNALIGDSTELLNEGESNQKLITNQELENQIFTHYKMRFKEESTKQTILYPTCFRVYLHPKDFTARKTAFNVIARDLANELNAFNRTKTSEYKNHKPHAAYWLFQFIEFNDTTIVEDCNSVNSGEPLILSTLYSQDFSKNKDNIRSEGNVVMTKQPQNSTNQEVQLNINMDAFLGMDMLDRNRFKIKITENYDEIIGTPRSEDKVQIYENEDVIAILICDKNFISGSKSGNKYNITNGYVEISGKNDSRKGSQYIKIDSDSLPDSIVHIKHENGKFLLAAFGKVRLNQMLVQRSAGGDLCWEELSDNSKMLINDEVSIEFKKIKK